VFTYYKGVIALAECEEDALIYGNEIYDNLARSSGMAIYLRGSGGTIENNLIYDNIPDTNVRSEIMVIDHEYHADVYILNNVIINNSNYATGIRTIWPGGDLFIYGNTIIGDAEENEDGHGIDITHDYQDEIYMFNNIIWWDGHYQVHNASIYSATVEMDYNCVMDGQAGLGGSFATYIDYGSNNIDDNPLITNWYHIGGRSPCKNAGSNSYINPPHKDIDGQIRANGTVDIGADEIW
jgi:parallel beta-helix repeat protein